MKLNDFKGALTDLIKAEQLGTKDAELYNNRGFVKLNLEDFNQAIELNDTMTKAFNGLMHKSSLETIAVP